ncbi:beta-lactamase family protein [Akkermansiaceae bacterium]|nr:beta-lactamase family protein [Akkermansiaceae bacterium]
MKKFLSSVSLALALPAAGATSTLQQALDSFAADQIESREIAGVTAEVGNREGILAAATAGFANIATGEKLAPDHMFWIASMTKPVTGTAMMMAVEKGFVAISDPVSKHLPEFKDLKGADGKPATITIAQILAHTSGLQDLDAGENATTTTLAELTALVSRKPLHFEPGSKWQYCQTGISTAARIIEVVSGKSFPDFLNESLFTPLGMKDTTFNLTEAQAKRLAVSYATTKDGFQPQPVKIFYGKPPTSTDRFPSAAGGLFSTAADYGRFARMILNGGELDGKRYLTAESIAEMTRSHTGDLKAGFVPGSNYGLGWIRVAEPVGVTAPLSPGSYGHGGAYGTQAWIDPAKGRYTVMMVQRTNFNNGDASGTRRQLQEAAAK